MVETPTSEHIKVEIAEGIMQIRMNRPEKKNALTRAMYRTMAEAVIAADHDNLVRVIMITGSEECFTSGNDLADFLAVAQATGARERNPFVDAMPYVQKPVIAAVNGVAVGIGTTMLLHCDLVYAGTACWFQLPFVNLGLCPELSSSLLLPRLAGHQKASEILLHCEPFNAETGREIGLVNGICADGKLFATARKKALQLAALPPAAVKVTKALIRRPLKDAVSETLEVELGHFEDRLRSTEAAEALQAFAEKRKPDFSRF